MIDYHVTDYPSRPTAVVRARLKVADLPGFFEPALTHVLAAMEAQGTTPGGEPFAYYRGIPNGMAEVEAGFPTVGPFTASGDVMSGELPAGRVITGLHMGPYETLKRTYAEMSQWAAINGLTPTGEMWQVFLTDPEREPDPSRWRIGIFLRVV